MSGPCDSYAGAPVRFDAVVRPRSHSNAEAESMSSVKRQRQFPAARPGTFHPGFLPEVEEVLKRSHGERGRRLPCRRINAGAASLLEETRITSSLGEGSVRWGHRR